MIVIRQASERQIGGNGTATVLLGDNVINLETC
jgi:hypothetical protein